MCVALLWELNTSLFHFTYSERHWDMFYCYYQHSYWPYKCIRDIQVASAKATRYGLSRGLLGLEYDRINISDSDIMEVKVIKKILAILCQIFCKCSI